MQFYQEITLLPDVNLSPYFLWTKVYTQLHLAFVEQQDDDGKIAYGVAFPQYRLKPEKQIGFLGFKVRVFAQTEAELQALNLAKWLERLTDYVHITSIRPVPVDKVTGFSHYYRVIPKMSLDERIVHQAARHDVSVDAAREHLKGYQTQATIEPYIQLKSQSTGHNFALHIGKQSADGLGDGKFGAYGLSRSAGVPEFG
ncbi:type I-F CRISPR-associated endoribonuclease Cas6/Csy4 [Moraxella pluranimalium]|uniref:Type I-F CRISPR-associated endoribonuclease Cas6/Csy4 n=1 Tax=Moraxella pluranimalium TaxID=470453 RepID=A0A1T0CR62_9GAMM|nr:type I-F CRISPR-associated endoribonuclease Cas6/Csy4 [Moraxella pluranimalium]OOS24845.1 type I-F CRISPR-associated endoribonuclease Cas6/Csy4 [Moraxella pluranimalium]